MASDLTPYSVVAPGFYGLNSQDSPTSLPKEFSLEAYNAVIDNFGRLAARKGWEQIITTASELDNSYVRCVHEYVNSAGGVELLVFGPNHLLRIDGSSATAIYSDVSWTGTNWKAVNFNDKAYFFQIGHAPLVYDGTTVQKITSHSSYSGTVQQADEVLSAYGRLWTGNTTTDKVTIKWSDSLIGEAWTGGASGSVNLETVFTNGTSPIVALAAFNGQLVVFCEKAIIVYNGADEDPSTNLALVDVIDGIGCVSRDSVVDVGTDIFFLSDTGVRSLGRLIDQRSAPIFDVSQNVRDALIEDVNTSGDDSAVKAVYSPTEGFYLLSLPGARKTYCFDLKKRLENNVCRVTTWNLAPTAMLTRRNHDLIFGFYEHVGKHFGYSDNGEAYRFKYRSSYLTHEKPEVFKMLKQARLTVYGGPGYTVAFRWSVDFDTIQDAVLTTLADYGDPTYYNNSTASEYGNNDYYYSSINRVQNVKAQIGGSGRVYQIEVETIINQYPFSIQEIDIFAKIGRMHNV